MEQYRTEEEQVEALRRWWDENGRSTIVAIVLALSVGFGWQSWKANDQNKRENASDIYQAMLQSVGVTESSAEQQQVGIDLAEQLKADYSGSSYAQFAGLHLAAIAVAGNDLAEAEAQLRWVLGKASKGSDAAQVAQLRLARVLASSGDVEQALAILDEAGEGSYQASYAVARGDILLTLERNDEARDAYTRARIMAATSQGQINMPALEQKLQSLTPIPARSSGELEISLPEEAGTATAAETEAVDSQEE